MHRHLRITIFTFLVIGLLSACRKKADHARFIPKDAVAIASLNLKGLSTKIAWNVVTGSKLFKEIQKRLPEKNAQDAMSGIENAGVDALNTIYVYVKSDTRFKGGNRITGLVPLSDAAKWEAFVKKSFPEAAIKTVNGRKEASLGRDMYVGWTDKLLMVVNVSTATLDTAEDSEGPRLKVASSMDQADISAEMDNAFKVTEDNSIVKNKLFKKFEDEGHDLGFWLNYEQLMTQFSGDMAEKVGVALSSSMWKDAVFTSGFDFKKGQIAGEMRYYLADDMKAVGKEFGANNSDKDMIERLPGNNLDMLLGIHLSTKGLKTLLEKTGLLGLVNVGLSSTGLNADYVLDAFTGDMSMVMNDFSLHNVTVTDTFLNQVVTHKTQKPSLNISYVVKINKKENFQKLVEMAKAGGTLQPIKGGYAMPLSDKDSVYILINDQYAAISNKYSNVTGILNGTFKPEKKSSPAFSDATSHPIAWYIDIQQLFNNIDANIAQSPRDSAIVAESRKLLSNMAFNGGEYKHDAVEFHLEVNFINKDENAILQLMDYGMKVNDADKAAEAAAH
jgi:hypothetical protein